MPVPPALQSSNGATAPQTGATQENRFTGTEAPETLDTEEAMLKRAARISIAHRRLSKPEQKLAQRLVYAEKLRIIKYGRFIYYALPEQRAV